METNLFPLFTPGNKSGLTNALLEAILNSVPVGMQFLSVIRDDKNEIIDFEYVKLNGKDQNEKAGKMFRNLHPGDQQLFERLKELVHTGIPFQTGHLSGAGDHQAMLSYMKFGDGILISRNQDPKKEWQLQLDEVQIDKPGPITLQAPAPTQQQAEPAS